ncbi:MAG: alpha-amylase family glycosyl hydrolase [Bacteroidota bacterium]|nr:alpha-amylase family glycosyl hydrolase [Bacteroidota bacterium]
MKKIMFVICFFSSIAIAQTSADSVTITFRAHKPLTPTVALPGQFSGWSTSNYMIYDGALSAWIKTYKFKIHEVSADRTLGDSVYQYKFNDGNWYADPLNPEQNPNDNNNSVLRLTKLFYFQFYSEEVSSQIGRIVIGIVHTNSDTVKSIKFYTGTSAATVGAPTEVLSSFDKTKNVLNYILPSPISKTQYMRLVATIGSGDSIVYQNTVVEVPLMPMPSYAKHGITVPSATNGDSVTFRLRVPGKSYVLLRIAPAGQPVATATPVIMRKDPSSDNWWVNVKLLPDTKYEYLYEIENGKKITDPFGRYVGTYGTQFSTGADGLSADNYVWNSTSYNRPPMNKLVIYELHIGEFAGGYYAKGAGQAGFSDLKNLLWYFDSLGINAIELMPLNDYGSVGKSGHSWGYDLNSYFAIEPAFGTPLELKQLIDAAHQKGIAIILDVVYNHQNDTGPLWQMLPDEAASPYFKLNSDFRYNEDNLAFFKDMDHWTAETQELILTNLKMWIDEYKVDGFRYDFTQGIGWNIIEPTKGILGWSNAIDTLYKGSIYQIAEHLPESPALIYYSGLNGGWHDSFRDELFDEARFQSKTLTNIENLVIDLGAYGTNDTPSSPSSYANRTEPVNATITHDELSLIYEMKQYQGVPETTAVLRDKLYGAFIFTSLGIPMLWEGQEFSEPRGWVNDKLNYRPVQFSYLNTQRGKDHFAFYRTLALQRRKNPALYQGQLKKLYRYDVEKVIVWGFEDTLTNSKVVAIANLHSTTENVTSVPWLGLGTWYNIHDQSQQYVYQDPISSITLDPYTVKIYSNKSDAQLGITAVSVSKEKFPETFALLQNYPNPFNPTTVIRYRLSANNAVSLKVYDIVGREVATLVNERQEAGSYQTSFNAQGLSSGLYYYQLRAGNYSEVKKMLLMK